MKRAPTNEQKCAIDAREGNYIVSASAGSGKTYVLTERVFNVLREGTNLNELLVLTFTNLAAAEMRDRVRDELLELHEPEMNNVAASLDAANIQTYDAFALNLVKKYHDRLGLPTDIKLVDAVLLSIEKNKILNSIFEDAFDKKDEGVLKLVNDYCYRDYDDLKEFILKTYDKIELVEDKKTYIDNFVKVFMSEKTIKSFISEFVTTFKKNIEDYIERIKDFENIDYIELNQPVLEALKSASSYDELHNLLIDQGLNVNAKGKASLKDYEDDQRTHKFIQDYIKLAKDNYFSFSSEAKIVEQYLGNKVNIETVLSIISELDNSLTLYKRRYNVYTFADIFKFAMQLTDIPDIRNELKNRYKYIMIDEYQDTNDLQERFIEKISNNNVYVVGDVKQAIYRFRNANSDIFLKKFNEYGKDNGGKRIELPENFRSRKEIIDTVNYIFSTLMSKENSDLNYEKEHKMKVGNKSFLPSNDSYETDFITYSREDLDEAECGFQEYEARLIATDIARKKANKFQVLDHETKQLRDCDYKDFAILIHVKTNFEIYQKVFNEYQIPLFAKYEKRIINNKLTIAFENIIRLIVGTLNNDYKHGYKHAYLSLMRSFLFEASDEEVDKIGSTNRYEDYELYHVILDVINTSKGKNLKEQINIIVDKFDIYNRAITIGNVSDTITLLEYYYNIASQMGDMGYELSDFLAYFDDLKEYDIEPSFEPNDDVENSVSLLSIHASKGLQFKICYFPDLSHSFNFKDAQKKLLYSSKYGIIMPNVWHETVTSFLSPLVLLNEKREGIKEEIRLFYVALTRPEEKIILVGNPEKRKNPIADFSKISSFLDFITFYDLKFNSYTFKPELIKAKEEKGKDKGVVSIKASPLMNGKLKEITHASKALDENSDSELLLLGEKYHYYLEISDFKSKDVSFIKNEKERALIKRFLANDIFKNAGEAKILHEYPFFDEVNNVRGVIDLLLIYEDHIDIVDFKLSHVNDEAYEKQVGKYKAYISQLSKLDIHTYIAGIMSGNIKAVE